MKIGIITHYYNSKNYGGNLQAYALQRYLAEKYTVEQICYQNSFAAQKSKQQLFKELGLLGFCKKVCIHVFRKLKACFMPKNKQVDKLLLIRTQAILNFNQKIPLILQGGRCDGGIESTVLDVTGEVPVIL